MQNFKEIILGEQAFAYVKKHLSYGHTLCKHVLESVDLHTGQIVTGLPEDANFKKVYEFERGGILPPVPESEWVRIVGENGQKMLAVPIPGTSYLNNLIGLFLSMSPNKVCVFENANAKTSDPYFHISHPNIYFYKEEVYSLLVGGDHSEGEIKAIVGDSKSIWNDVGFMTSSPEDFEEITGRKISKNQLRALATRVEKIIVGAYDGEGYLIWHKESSNIPS